MEQRLYKDGDTQPIPLATPRDEGKLAWGELPPGAPRYYTPMAERPLPDTYDLADSPWPGSDKMVPGSWRSKVSGAVSIGPLAKWGIYIPLIAVNTIGVLFSLMLLSNASLVSYENSTVPQNGPSVELARHLALLLSFALATWSAFRVVYRDLEVKIPRTPILLALPWALVLLGLTPLGM